MFDLAVLIKQDSFRLCTTKSRFNCANTIYLLVPNQWLILAIRDWQVTVFGSRNLTRSQLQFLNFTSQTWLTSAESSQPVWNHRLTICVPYNVSSNFFLLSLRILFVICVSIRLALKLRSCMSTEAITCLKTCILPPLILLSTSSAKGPKQ